MMVLAGLWLLLGLGLGGMVCEFGVGEFEAGVCGGGGGGAGVAEGLFTVAGCAATPAAAVVVVVLVTQVGGGGRKVCVDAEGQAAVVISAVGVGGPVFGVGGIGVEVAVS